MNQLRHGGLMVHKQGFRRNRCLSTCRETVCRVVWLLLPWVPPELAFNFTTYQPKLSSALFRFLRSRRSSILWRAFYVALLIGLDRLVGSLWRRLHAWRRLTLRARGGSAASLGIGPVFPCGWA